MPARPRLIAVPAGLDGRTARLYTAAAAADPYTARTSLRAWAEATARARELTDCVLTGCDWPDTWETLPDGRQARRCRRDGCGLAQTRRGPDDLAPRPAIAALLTS